ncbi:MAG: alpha/beta hydrolase [Fusobacteriota bacterium]
MVSKKVNWFGKMSIGNIKQWILIRGKNIENPIIIFLHGGPGTSFTPFISDFQKELEKEFIVVNWDQRGAGKTFSKKTLEKNMKISQFVQDTYDLIIKLKKRFKKNKVYLVGHSWGSVIGLEFINEYPDLIKSYIGVGQVINFRKENEISYKYTLSKAKKIRNKKAIKSLQKIGPPPYLNYKDEKVQRKWLEKFEGKEKGKSFLGLIIKGILTHPRYTLIDAIKYIRGLYFSQDIMEKELSNVKFDETIKKVEVPIYFFEGKYDYLTPSCLVKRFFKNLEAPTKKFIWFEKSAHFPLFTEHKKFNDNLIKIKKDIKNN